jgi:CDGSH-type Zn-finger protein
MNNTQKQVHVAVSKNGPYVVTGSVRLSKQTIGADAQGGSETWIESKAYPTQESYALCRCGQSKGKPYCDGTHSKIGFDGTETASREPYQNQAKVQDGPEMQLLDAEVLCALARFCDPNGQVWNQLNQTESPGIRETFIRQVGNCPSGRLTARDRSNQRDIEPQLPISIGLVEDPTQGCSGPLWVRGRIPVAAADGFQYEVRNRVTLCRCGQSKNKPFCDGTHVSIKFKGE